MQSQIAVRRATLTDLDQFVLLLQTLSAEKALSNAKLMQQRWEELLTFNGSSVFVAEQEDQLLSTCTLIIVPNLTRSGQPYALIENVVTLECARNRGFAQATLNAALEYAWSKNCYKVMLLSGGTNSEAHQLYKKIGFTCDKIGFQIRQNV
jgi:GNAT superfamily N-acetyltransferase